MDLHLIAEINTRINLLKIIIIIIIIITIINVIFLYLKNNNKLNWRFCNLQCRFVILIAAISVAEIWVFII